MTQTNNYLNQKFDILMFDPNDQEGIDCYKNAVFNLKWDSDCKFADQTLTYLNVENFSDWIDGLDQIEELSGTIIVDNTPLPKGGASSDLDLQAMMSIRTEFAMQYNIKHLTIYCGLACLLLLFVIFGQIYLYCKLRRDTNSKRAKISEEYSGGFEEASSKLLPKTD